jgi:hypothetical protein
MRKDCLLLLLVLLISFLGSCSDDPAEPEDDPNAEYYVLQDGVVLIDISEQLNSGYIWWDTHPTKTPPEPELRCTRYEYLGWPQGGTKILYYIPSEKYPDIPPEIPPLFLRYWRLEGRPNNSECLATVETDLVEVFKECHIHRTIPLKLNQGDFELPDDTVELIDTGNLALTKLNVIAAKLGAACSGQATTDITINRGTIEVKDPVLKLDIDISNSVLRQFRVVTQSRNKIDVDMSLDLDVSQKCTFSKEIFKLKPPKIFTVQAGPIPVVIAVDFSIAVGCSLGGAVSVDLTLNDYATDVTTWSGLEYKNDSDQPCDPESSCFDRTVSQKVHSYSAASEPVLDAEVEVYFEAFVKETVSATVYGTVGPTVWFRQYIKPEATWATSNDECANDNINDLCQGYVRVVAGLDVGGGLVVKFANKTIASWQPSKLQFKPIEKTLWDDCFNLADYVTDPPPFCD